MRRIEDYKGYKNKMKSKIDLKSKINNFIPGMYIIYVYKHYNWKTSQYVNTLILGNIIGVEENKYHNDDKGHYVEYYIKIKYVDFISDIESDINLEGDHYFNIEKDLGGLNNVFYSSSSLKDTKIKFDELKSQSPYSEWLINNDANKYNL